MPRLRQIVRPTKCEQWSEEEGRGRHGRVSGAYLGGLASPHGLVADGGVVLDRGNDAGYTMDTRLDAAAGPLWAEPPAARGVLHVRHRLHLSPRTPSSNAQRVGPILPSPHPSVWAIAEVTPRPTVGLIIKREINMAASQQHMH